MTPTDGGIALQFASSTESEPPPASAEFSEDSLALQFSAHHGGELRFVAAWNKWLRWDGAVWVKEETYLAFDLARQICRNNLDIPGATEPIKRKLCDASTVSGVIKMASADRQHAAESKQWDSDPWILNTPTGIVDLKSGQLLKHDPLLYCSKITSVGPSNRRPELWLAFLDRIFPDKSIIPFLQRMCGYMLTGSTREHSLFFAHGTGKNGKGKFSEVLSGILNTYSREAPIEQFTEQKSDQHPTGLAGLQGARLALCPETEKNSYWLESKLKQVTGGDRLTARYMRGDYFDFVPQFKLFVSGNHRPRLRSVDEAIRRRMNLVPFTITIPEGERDTKLGEKLRTEWDAILGWMVQGCLRWQAEGLNPPEAVKIATEEYLAAEDKLGRWLDERCVLGPNESAIVATAYLDYCKWCDSNGERASSKKVFSQELCERPGIGPKSTAKYRGYSGFSLLGDEPDDSWQESKDRF